MGSGGRVRRTFESPAACVVSAGLECEERETMKESGRWVHMKWSREDAGLLLFTSALLALMLVAGILGRVLA